MAEDKDCFEGQGGRRDLKRTLLGKPQQGYDNHSLFKSPQENEFCINNEL